MKSLTYRVFGLLVALIVLAIPVVGGAQDALTPGTPVSGEYTGEPVVYTLDATRGQLLLISMTAEEMDSVVGIGQGGEEWVSDDDGGGDDNSLLSYVVQEDGTYEVFARASFWSEGDPGAYELSVEVVDPTVAAYGEAVTLSPADAETRWVYTVFEAAADDVVHVWTETTGTEDPDDLVAELIGTDGLEIERDDDDWYGRNSLIRRVVLPEAGLYLVRVRPASSNDFITADAQVTVEQTERLFLSPEPQELVLGDAQGEKGTEVFFIDATAGTTYRISVTIEPFPDEDAGIEMELFDTQFFFDPYLETRHGVGAVWDYTAQADGQIRLDVHPNFFGTDISQINYTIAMEEVTE